MDSTEQQQLEELKWKINLMKIELDSKQKELEFRSNAQRNIPKQLLPPIPFKPKPAFLLPYRNLWG